MKMNYWIIGLVVGIVGLSSMVFFITKEELIKDDVLSYESDVVSNDEVRIKKIEKSNSYSYVIDDKERNLVYTWSFPKMIDDSLDIDKD